MIDVTLIEDRETAYTILICFLFYIAMGNEKANSYWEAELPPNYDRVGIENFIRAKYVRVTPRN